MSGQASTARPLSAGDQRRLVHELYTAEATALTRAQRGRHGADDAIDLVHDAFLRLLGMGSNRLSVLAEQRPAAYLWRVAQNLARDRAKRELRRSARMHVALDDRERPGPDPLHQLEARDDLRRVEQAVLAMRPRTRAIFVAHRIGGLSYAEIAVHCGIGVKGVEKQMSRALAILSRELDGADHG